MLLVKWEAKFPSVAEYLKVHVLKHKFSRCDDLPGKPSTTNAHERMNRELKSENHYNTIEGLGTVLSRAQIVGYRMSRDTVEMQMAPIPTREDWKKAQALEAKGWANLGFKLNDSFVVPSEKLLDDLVPKQVATVAEKRTYIKTWANEFVAMMRNPKTYKKLTDGSYDFDILCDMAFSFWVITPIPASHKKKEVLAGVGIKFTCTCPRFGHYHVCKHVLAWGKMFADVKVPMRFSTETAGKRKAQQVRHSRSAPSAS